LTSNRVPEKCDKKLIIDLIITALPEKCDNVTHIIRTYYLFSKFLG